MGASLLGIILVGKGLIRTDKGPHRARENVLCYFILCLILKFKDMIKMNLDLMGFIEEVMTDYKGWDICNKSWWIS